MDWHQVRDDWPKVRGKVQAKWVKLTDGDLVDIGGRRTALIKRVRQRYAADKRVVAKEVEHFVKQLP